jgi:two-component system nitrogen regulation response regulator NtrX
MKATILIVDDERNVRRMLRALLEAEGYEVAEADGGDAALASLERASPDVMLLDLVMPPGLSGLSVLERLDLAEQDLGIVMMSGKATLDDAVQATKLGAFQFLEKPLTPEGVLTTIAAAVALRHARHDARALRAEVPGSPDILGSSRAIAEVRKLVARVAPTPARVLVSGASGTGKELVARAIHLQSPRGGRPMVTVNCAAVPKDLLESEMFGHDRGAFTGAVAGRQGKFELADRSTLFLDEVGDMPLDAQAKLLRALETNTIQRLGSERERTVDVRVIAATNKDLEREVAARAFRDDLFFRLNVFPIQVPPLRDRLEDLPELITHLADRAATACARTPLVFGREALARLVEHEWPGNVRELANVVERLTIVGSGGVVTAGEVDAVLGPSRRPGPKAAGRTLTYGLTAALEAYELELIRSALAEAHGNVARAARRLRTDRANLYRRMKRLGLSPSDTGVSQ